MTFGRAFAKALMLVALIAGFVGLAAVLHVRSAIAQGALDQPNMCLNKRHADWRTGNYLSTQTLRLTAKQVRYFYLDDENGSSTNRHLRGAFAGLGVWLGYSDSEQRAMAEQVIAAMPPCPGDR